MRKMNIENTKLNFRDRHLFLDVDYSLMVLARSHIKDYVLINTFKKRNNI